MRYLVKLSYFGEHYSGWQRQPNGKSVQEILEDCISLKVREKIAITGAGRTDTGVHAKLMIAHFDVNKKVSPNLVKDLNAFLPFDIAISEIKEVSDDFHARFSALSRSYEYLISISKNPFFYNLSWQLNYNLDIDKMNEACKLLIVNSDFTSFCKLHSDNKTNICKLTNAEFKKENNGIIVFYISADRFLRNMVRAIVGTLVDVGRGKISIADFDNIIKNKDRGLASMSAPAKGLYLSNIIYPEKFGL